jgi:hypothetical protein
VFVGYGSSLHFEWLFRLLSLPLAHRPFQTVANAAGLFVDRIVALEQKYLAG